MAKSGKIHLGFLGEGLSYHVHKWLPALAEQGLRVTLVTYHPPPHPLDGVDVHVLKPPFGATPETMRWPHFLAPSGRVRRTLADLGIDVVLASYATSYGLLGMRTGFQPLLLNTWTYDVSVYPFEGWKQYIFRPLVKKVLRRSHRILTDGAALASFVQTHYPEVADRVEPILWGIRLADYPFSPERRAEARARWQIPPEAPVVISARGVMDWYRPEVILPAFERVLASHPEAHAVVLTLTHARTPAVQAMLDRLAAHPRAHVFDRFLEKPEMVDAWAASDVLVSIPPHDGISVGILEGMYAGALPVVSDIESNRSFLTDDRAFFVEGDDPEALAATLTATLADLDALRARIAPANRAWIAKHGSVTAAAGRVADIVREVAALHTADAGTRGRGDVGRD